MPDDAEVIPMKYYWFKVAERETPGATQSMMLTEPRYELKQWSCNARLGKMSIKKHAAMRSSGNDVITRIIMGHRRMTKWTRH